MANQPGVGGGGDGGGPSPPKKLKTASIQEAQQTLFILEATEERMNPQGTKYGVTTVLASTTNFAKRHELYIAEKHVQKIYNSKLKTVLVKGFTLGEDSSIRISEHSIITNIIPCPTSKRIVTIKDNTGDIEVKLWSDKVNLVSTAGHAVEMTCLTVDNYMGRVSLNSNISTDVKIVDTEDTIEGTVVAACFEECTCEQSVCCQDIPEIRCVTEEDHRHCITKHYGFSPVCLHPSVLRTAYHSRNNFITTIIL